MNSVSRTSLQRTAAPILAHMFSAVVIMAVVTTVATPILLRRALRRHDDRDEEHAR